MVPVSVVQGGVLALFPSRTLLLAVLVLAGGVLAGAAALRGMEYDEAYTLFLVAGDPRPAWPEGAFRAGDAAALSGGAGSAADIAADLRRGDVHPPLYFWTAAAWRALAGPGLLAARLLSVAFALAALALVGAIARETAVPPAAAMALTLGCYAFAYTGAIARGFALAQALSLAGVWLLLLSERRGAVALALAGGLALGAASFANYLAVFVAAAALGWLLVVRPRGWLWPAAGLGFAAFLPGDVWFFLAQRASRPDQFAPFDLAAGLARLGRYAAASLFGGLAMYVEGAARLVVGAALAGLLVALVALVARFGLGGRRWLLAGAALAPPAGLLALGVVFDTTPIELRYLAFATPFAALLLAGACARMRRGGAVCAVVLAVQAAALAGLVTRPETMQPQAASAREAARLAGPDGLVLVAFGHDGVGVPGPFVQALPDEARVMVLRRPVPPAWSGRVVLALLGPDRESAALVAGLRAAFAADACWRRAEQSAGAIAFERAC